MYQIQCMKWVFIEKITLPIIQTMWPITTSLCSPNFTGCAWKIRFSWDRSSLCSTLVSLFTVWCVDIILRAKLTEDSVIHLIFLVFSGAKSMECGICASLFSPTMWNLTQPKASTTHILSKWPWERIISHHSVVLSFTNLPFARRLPRQ